MSACLMLLFASGYAQGIQFANKNWEEVLALARVEQKTIFMDAYATWCGPCKMMDRNTFSDEDVSRLYNARFVNVKMDMEKGEGPALAERYGVRAYPTLLFIDGNGDVVHRAVGYHDADQFVELGQVALDNNRNMQGLTRRYQAGNQSPELMKEIMEAKAQAMDPDAEKFAVQVLSTQKDLNTPANREIIMEYIEDPESPYMAEFIRHTADYTAQFGQDRVNAKKQQIVMGMLQTNNPLTPAEALPKLRSVYGNDVGLYHSMYTMLYGQTSGDINLFAEGAVGYYEAATDVNSMQLNNIAWMFYENVDDKSQLKKALGWAERSVKMEPGYSNLDTAAALHYKLGNKKQARDYAKKAIAMAKITGEDSSSTEDLLKKLK
jgi:thioredoxin-related protein